MCSNSKKNDNAKIVLGLILLIAGTYVWLETDYEPWWAFAGIAFVGVVLLMLSSVGFGDRPSQ